MELTWLADTPQSRRRTRAIRACANCQRRKKRCRHLDTGQALSRHLVEHNDADFNHNHQPVNPSIPDRPTGQTAQLLSPGIPQPERFVGDLNPESVIREKLDTSENPLRNPIGLWISARSNEGSRADLSNPDVTPENHLLEQNPGPQSVATILSQRYASAMKACDHLPHSTKDRLVSIYFSSVNHMLPLVDKDSFLHADSQGATSTFLERAICLVAAKDKAAGSYLRLTTDGPLMTSRQFCSDIYKGLVVAMDVGLETDRVTRIRTLALMSLHCEGYEGAEAASMHLCQAIHQSQTAGLHLERPGRVAGDSLSSLFWCLWSLDKMHASIGGRPILLADRDIGLERPKPSNPRSAFDIWFAISDLLSTVISFYRPSAGLTVGWETNFPTFEEIIGDNLREDLDFTTLGFLELYYHAVGILSCRSKLFNHPDSSNSSIRQGLAAVRIYSIIATECAQGLLPLPIVPYALALSMGVSYQQFRSSKLITHFNRAKASLEACCTLLEELSLCWYSAEAMARLGRRALHQIEGAKLEYHRQRPDSKQPTASAIINTLENLEDSASAMQLPAYDGNILPINNVSSAAPVTVPSTYESLQPQISATEDAEQHGFEDIDILFGDFLDLSLPTNFWDPVFFTEGEHTGT